MPHDLVTESYPNIGKCMGGNYYCKGIYVILHNLIILYFRNFIDHEEGKAQYAKRVFVGLLFLADSYNRQKSAATLTSIRDPIQIHLSNAPQSSQRSCSVLVNFRWMLNTVLLFILICAIVFDAKEGNGIFWFFISCYKPYSSALSRIQLVYVI